MKRRNLYTGILCVALLSACKKDLNQLPADQNQASASQNAIQNGKQFSNSVPNEILVKFKKGIQENIRANILTKITGKISEKVLTKTMQRFGDDEGFFVVHTPLAALDAISKVKALPEIEYAEPNFIYQHDAVSDDPYYTNGSLWGMYGDATNPLDQYGSQAGEAWAVGHTGANNVVVGVIDEGAMYSHPDLKANIKNPVEFNGVPGIDDDGNGFVDDIHGWDFVSNDNSTYDGSADDHGTHVSGTIGAKGGNSAGVAGVCWKVRIISAKFLGINGGTTANAIKAVDYITNLKIINHYNLVATNNSWGGGGYSQALYDAISRANAQNILFIAAAGNGGSDQVGDNNDNIDNYPSNYNLPNVIAVAAITSSGGLASFSNYGATTVDLGAPGVGIYSTLPASNGTATYGSYSGTSMATPHVTGAAALYASTHPGATAAQIKTAILNSTIATASLQGKTVTGGRLNVSGF
jgi:subtilisin family serine protease